MRIVFMGTPEFAVPCLSALLEAGHEVAGVYTQPDKPKGRGYQLTPPPVKSLALAHAIPVFQPKGFKEEGAVETLRALSPELIVVVAYGRLLPKAVLGLPKFGCVNVHASLLPKYRGAGPIQWAVINGEEKTGVTTMFMAEGLDTGDMLLKAETPIGPDETADELHDRLAKLGAGVLLDTINQLYEGKLTPEKQDDRESSWAPPLHKSLGALDFSRGTKELYSLIRGVSPWPGAFTGMGEKTLKVHRARPSDKKGAPGTLLDDKRLIVGAGDGSLELLEVQLQGSRRISGEELIRGQRIKAGYLFKLLS